MRIWINATTVRPLVPLVEKLLAELEEYSTLRRLYPSGDPSPVLLKWLWVWGAAQPTMQEVERLLQGGGGDKQCFGATKIIASVTHWVRSTLNHDFSTEPSRPLGAMHSPCLEEVQPHFDRLCYAVEQLRHAIRPAPEKSATPRPSALPEVLPELVGAPELARLLEQPVSRVESFLRRFAANHKDCCVTTDNPRRNEVRNFYRTVDFRPELEKQWAKWQEQPPDE